MAKQHDYISPTHINKFVNCQYKWHYETKSTQKELNQLYKEYKINNGIVNDKQFKAFAIGNEFHSNYLKQQRKEFILRFLIISLTIVGALICTYIIYY